MKRLTDCSNHLGKEESLVRGLNLLNCFTLLRINKIYLQKATKATKENLKSHGIDRIRWTNSYKFKGLYESPADLFNGFSCVNIIPSSFSESKDRNEDA